MPFEPSVGSSWCSYVASYLLRQYICKVHMDIYIQMLHINRINAPVNSSVNTAETSAIRVS